MHSTAAKPCRLPHNASLAAQVRVAISGSPVPPLLSCGVGPKAKAANVRGRTLL